MKQFLLLCFLLATVACTKDAVDDNGAGREDSNRAILVGSSDGAEKGTLALKVSPEVADAIESAQKTRGDQTRSGIDQMDLVFNKIGVERFYRIIPFDPEREAALQECGLSYWYRIDFEDEESLEAVAEQLRSCTEISVVEYTHRLQKMSKGPVRPLTDAMMADMPQTRATAPMNDPQLGYQWHYNNSGATTAFPKRQAGADVNLFDAWGLCTGGEDIIVAVIDEPVQYTHPDLAANMWRNPNPTQNDLHGYNFWNKKAQLDWVTSKYNTIYQAYEYADHGSHVAGTIAAVNNNGIGCCGIAGGKSGSGGVKIMSCQILGYSNLNVDNDADIKAFKYAADNGAVIAQCSFGYDAAMTETSWNNGHSLRRAAIDYFINNAGSKNSKFPNAPIAGGLVIFAAGNDGHNVQDKKTWPSAYAPVIAVASIGWDFQPAYYTDYGSWVDITAPGGDYTLASPLNGMYQSEVLSTILQDPAMSFKDNRNATGCGFMQGTSMACPHVSGVAALGLAYASKLGKKFTPKQFTDLLLSSTYDISPYLSGTKPYYDDNGLRKTLTLSNYQNKMGRGSVDALRLLLSIKGTPAIGLTKGVSRTIDLSQFFGGVASTLTVTKVSIDAEGLQRVGLTSVPQSPAGYITFKCPNVGSAIVSVEAKAGDTSVTREFAIVVRENVPQSGGWL